MKGWMGRGLGGRSRGGDKVRDRVVMPASLKTHQSSAFPPRWVPRSRDKTRGDAGRSSANRKVTKHERQTTLSRYARRRVSRALVSGHVIPGVHA